MNQVFELERVRQLGLTDDPLIRSEVLGTVELRDECFELIGIVIGSDDPKAPTFGVFGGVHGLERIGSHVALHWLESLVGRLAWDQELRRSFQHARLITIPVVNPGGMYLKRRSNPSGVDLMRNAPVDAENATFMVGGHRLGSYLPWFRGHADAAMEIESQALCDFVWKYGADADVLITLDCHSGFGSEDRLWHPYAKKIGGFPDERSALGISELLSSAHPHHVYIVEPQAQQYTTHGDLWDFLYDRHLAHRGGSSAIYLPWTLEMGSWAWVRKNPRQAFTLLGPFNPMISHRYRRTMRRHMMLFEVLWAATRNAAAWQRERVHPTS